MTQTWTQLTCICSADQEEQLTELLWAYDAQSVSTTPKDDHSQQLIATFETAPTFETFPIAYTLNPLDLNWEKEETLTQNGLTISCPNTVFGNLQHATTQLCLEALQKQPAPTAQTQLTLELGTGSGILALNAYKKGHTNLLALDNDPIAVTSAQQNATQNNIPSTLFIEENALTYTPPQTVTLLIANLLTPVIEQGLPHWESYLAPNATLILSGISTTWEKDISTLLTTRGYTYTLKTKDQWCCFVAKPS